MRLHPGTGKPPAEAGGEDARHREEKGGHQGVIVDSGEYA